MEGCTVGFPLRFLAGAPSLAAETIKKEFLFHFYFSLLVPRLISPGPRILGSIQLALGMQGQASFRSWAEGRTPVLFSSLTECLQRGCGRGWDPIVLAP